MVNTRSDKMAAQALLSLRDGDEGNSRSRKRNSRNTGKQKGKSRRGGNNSWFQELMKFNSNQDNFCIPRRGTPDYNKIMSQVRPSSGPSLSSRRSNRNSIPPPPAGPPPVPAGPAPSSSRPVRQRNQVVRYKNK